MKYFRYLNPLYWIKKSQLKRLEAAEKLKAKLQQDEVNRQTEKYLQSLIDEYRLIMKKKSTLPLSKRKSIIDQVEKLIESGHILKTQ